MLRIYNSLTRSKEEFVPLEDRRVRMYVCGMTVYDWCHIGHARVLVVFDVVQRWLRASGYALTYVRNITDIDDKIIRRAVENGETIGELTERFIRFMHEDADALGVERPDHEPRATRFVPQMLGLIERLEQNGLAYRADDGDVNFAVRGFPGYGRLSGKSLDALRAGERVAVADAKRDPLDFVLWKAARPDEPEQAKWPSPYGSGRPGWHIECSAMATSLLGETIDIHGGGADLQFPHHENEIAQSEGALRKPFVRYWMHNGFVRVDDEKMSKSLGNFFTVREVLKKFDAEVIRLFILRAHYRSPLNYSDAHLLAQQPAQHARAERGGQLRVQRRHQQVAGHHRLRPGGHGGPERGQLDRVEAGPVAADAGQVVVRVDPGVAVSGEVLGAGGDAAGLQAAYPGGGVPGDQVRVGAERAHPDHRVGRVGVDVGVRGVVQSDADGCQFGAEVAGDLLGQRRVVDRAERVVAGPGAAPGGLDPGDVAGLLVDRHDDVRPLGPQVRGERGDLLVVDDVAGEQDDRAEPFAEPAAHPRRRRGADEPRLQDGGGERRQISGRSLGPLAHVLSYPRLPHGPAGAGGC